MSMYRERLLTPAELALLDPTGRGRACIKGMKETAPTPKPRFFERFSRQEWLSRWQLRRDAHKVAAPDLVVSWERAADSKFGPQGDSFSLSEVQEVYRESYALARIPRHYQTVLKGRDYLTRLLRERVAFGGYPQIVPAKRYATSASLPTMLKKGDVLAESVGFSRYRHVLPMLPGQRSQRLKHRVINQDPVANVRLFEDEMNAIRNWLKTNFPEFFSAWLRPDLELLPRLTRAMQRPNSQVYSVEIDYRSCDVHFSWDLARTVILPVYESLIPSPVVFCEFYAYIEELFNQPLFFGTYIWEGLHNLFSGQNITNDFETIYDVCLQLGVLCELLEAPENVLMLSLGDDQSVVTHDKSLARELFAGMCEEANRNGMTVAPDKSGLHSHSVRFCRRLYHPKAPRDERGLILGIYPTSLALNNMVNPERHCTDPVEVVVQTLQRLDNVYGSPYFTLLAQFIGSNVDWTPYRPSQFDAVPIQDWWDRVYGTVWSHRKSVAFQTLQKHGWLLD